MRRPARTPAHGRVRRCYESVASWANLQWVTALIHDAPAGALVRALVLIHRYSVDLTEIAVQSLGGYDLENREIQVILAVQRDGPLTPTSLAEATGASRSTVARAVTRLDAAGLVRKAPAPDDGRSVLISITSRGRRRVTSFTSRLGDYFSAGEPLLKETFDLLGIAVPDRDPTRNADPMLAARAMSHAGAAYGADVRAALAPFGVHESADRFVLVLIHHYGSQRPGQIGDELHLSPSGTSGVLARLERAGLVSRRHDLVPGDRRAVVVTLTPRGELAVSQELQVFARHAPDLARALSLTW